MKMYRMPMAFGNSPGPRSDLEGQRFDWSEARRLSVSWQLPFDEDAASRMLPARVELRPGLSLLEFQKLENLPWLAGRGYTLFSVKLPVRFRTASSTWRDMRLLLVMFENLADPIITGRDELGFAKVFADLALTFTDAKVSKGSASWFGTEFFSFHVGPPRAPSENDAPADLLHHRYVPAVGEWGKALVEQYTCSPAASVRTAVSCEHHAIEARFVPAPWSALPTLSHIVQGLCELGLSGITTGRVERFVGGAEHYGQHVLE
jgi:hypothetical protein